MQGQPGRVDGLDRCNGIALNARDLDQAAHGVAGHAQVVRHARTVEEWECATAAVE